MATLFDTMFGAWNAGTQAQEQQVQLQLDKQQLQFNQNTLMSMQAAQQAAYQIFGPGGPSAALKATDNPAEGDSAKLKQMAAWLLKQPNNKGYLDDGIKMLTAASAIDQRTAKTKEDQQAAEIKKWTDLGSMAGSILQTGDQQTYAATFDDLKKQLPAQLQQMFNGDLAHDAKGLQYLASRGQTYSQQQAGMDREQKMADNNTIAEARLKVAQGSLDNAQRRTDAYIRDVNNRQQYRDKNEQRLADKDQWYRDHPRGQGKKMDGLVGKIPDDEMQIANSTVASDDRTYGLSSDDQKTVAARVAEYARKTYMGHEDAEHDLAFPDALDKAMDDYDKQGRFKQTPGKAWSGPKPVVPTGGHHPFAGSTNMNVDAQINGYTDAAKLAADYQNGKLGPQTRELYDKVMKRGQQLTGGK